MPRTEFHRLRVTRVDQLTGDSAAGPGDGPPGLAQRVAFAPGQSLTVRRGGERRSYSICAPRGRAPRIGVREVAGGAVSGWLVHEVRPGDVIEVQAPSGSFTPDLEVPGHHVLIAAGSGITPVLSIAASVLAAQDKSVVTLLYGNRRNDSVMFADEIADLKDAYPERICLVHVLSREAQEVELFNGRLDAAKLRALLPVTVDVGAVDHWWLCGPFGLVEGAIGVLAEPGAPRRRIHRELFYVEDAPPAPATHAETATGPGRRAARAAARAAPPDAAARLRQRAALPRGVRRGGRAPRRLQRPGRPGQVPADQQGRPAGELPVRHVRGAPRAGGPGARQLGYHGPGHRGRLHQGRHRGVGHGDGPLDQGGRRPSRPRPAQRLRLRAVHRRPRGALRGREARLHRGPGLRRDDRAPGHPDQGFP